MELDSTFLLALRLLHSQAQDSHHSLRLLLEETISSSQGVSRDLAQFESDEAPVSGSGGGADDHLKSQLSNDLELDLLKDDLACVVCKNKLFECCSCHFLYHQECHQPPLSEAEAQHADRWTCSTCRESSIPQTAEVKKVHSSSSSSKSHHSKSNGGSSRSHIQKPNINIISADKRLQIMKKKAAKLHEKKKLSK